MMNERGSGVLLHITSLPSPLGIGDLGPEAYRFASWLAAAGQRYWQVLPLSSTDPARGNNPYSSASAFAGNPLLASPDLMVREGLLDRGEIENHPDFPPGTINYDSVIEYKGTLFGRAFERFKRKNERSGFDDFCAESRGWLEDYALFMALKDRFRGATWESWPEEIRSRMSEAMEGLKIELREKIEKEKFLQYLFFRQWRLLKDHCNELGIKIIGDMPIYVDHDSADVWSNPQIFKLGEDLRPLCVSGVPPDYFSETGQLWGNPVYRWDVLKRNRYGWWARRFDHSFRLFDFLRVDHFRGFVAYWEVPAGEKTAIGGSWVEVPAEDFFSVLMGRFGELPIIAEDLGVITPDVREIMRRFGFPGMKVLLFAFGEDLPKNPYAPHNHIKNCIVYPGTHDNNTVRGWFENEATKEERKRLESYLGHALTAENVHLELVRLAMASVADTAIVSMQDHLGLGEEARMNRPAVVEGNYRWRLLPDEIDESLAAKLFEMTEIYGRIGGPLTSCV